jgi:hypothetical protein
MATSTPKSQMSSPYLIPSIVHSYPIPSATSPNNNALTTLPIVRLHRMQSLVDLIQDMILIVSPQGRILYASPGAQGVIGTWFLIYGYFFHCDFSPCLFIIFGCISNFYYGLIKRNRKEKELLLDFADERSSI